jgi:hypothetical protein
MKFLPPAPVVRLLYNTPELSFSLPQALPKQLTGLPSHDYPQWSQLENRSHLISSRGDFPAGNFPEMWCWKSESEAKVRNSIGRLGDGVSM